MTSQNLTLRSLDIPSIHKFGIGFDSIFDEINRLTASQTTNYPPYNIVKIDEDRFNIEIAVAGFREGDLSVVVEKSNLSIKGEQKTDIDTPSEYLYRGISARSFTRSFTLADHVEVVGATVENGILTVQLERKVPDADKPKQIDIAYTK
jgi:molecular chaperone IbpA